MKAHPRVLLTMVLFVLKRRRQKRKRMAQARGSFPTVIPLRPIFQSGGCPHSRPTVAGDTVHVGKRVVRLADQGLKIE